MALGHVSPLNLSSLHNAASALTPNLEKEHSTVGDLVSFTDRRTKPLQNETFQRKRHLSESDVRDDPKSSRRHSLRRTSSVGSLVSTQSRTLSLSNAREDENEKPDELLSKTERRRNRRRQSMMNLIRDDLDKIPCLQALSTRRSEAVESDVEPDENDDIESWSPRPTRRTRRSSSVFTMSEARKSIASFEGSVLTESEIRKLRMLQTLNKMDSKANSRYKRNDSVDSQLGELAILEASFGRGRKSSIATHVLVKTKHQRKAFTDRGHNQKADLFGRAKSPKRRESLMVAEEQQERAKKMFQMLSKKQESPRGGNEKGGDVAKNVMMGFKRRLRKKRFRPLQVWRKKAKFLVLLLRAWKVHSNNINESLVDNNSSLDMITRGNQVDLMFDITEYKAAKEANIPPAVKKILLKKQKERTDEEQYYVQIFLRNYKSIAEYPVKMQKMIAQRAWIESYDIKRVIVREGHVPMCFYFILSGSAIVSTMENGVPKTVMFLNRGDSFGDVAILNHAHRETTVITRDKIELLCMTDTDFVDIFMSGGIRDSNDPFLQSINFLKGWPRELLIDNPKRCIFSYFKRGTILVTDTSHSDWIIVVKSGSASLLKKLQNVNVKKKKTKEQFWDLRDEVISECPVESEAMLSHEEQVQLMFEEEKRNVEDQNLHVRFFALPEINVKTNDSYNELKLMKDEYMNANTVNRALGQLEKLADAGADVRSETGNSTSMRSESVKKLQMSRRKSLAMLKGPFKSMGGVNRESSFASISSRNGIASREAKSSRVAFDLSVKPVTRGSESNVKPARRESYANLRLGAREGSEIDNIQKVDDWQEMALPTMVAGSPIRDLTIKPPEARPVFVEIQALLKGQVFNELQGLAEMLFENQPNFSLVSNGAECIMIEKKFYMENASQAQIVKLKEMTFPYPSNENLQSNLENKIRWDLHKKLTINTILRDVNQRKSDVNDARSTLRLPPVR
ncbi:uncharacterized protein LOC128216051 [Mya arenaria]|uniref:uncharacterized protein LOC128216051 n=1 Tax=Mya arenaria TaxID=6604 RepID=UPI0022E11873|nr:uncharacterized protein LOC128216051 [Mya arenaria]